MALNLDKLVNDAKQSGSAKEAVVFIVQNIAMLINDAAGDPNRGAELYKEINAQAQNLANAAIDNRDVQPVAPHEDAHDTSVHRTNPTQPTLTGASPPPVQTDVPKPRLDPQTSAGSAVGSGPHVDTEQSKPRTNPAEPKAKAETASHKSQREEEMHRGKSGHPAKHK